MSNPKQRKQMLKNFDFLLLATVFALVGIGLVVLANTSTKTLSGEEQSLSQILSRLSLDYSIKHLRSFGIGLFVLCLLLIFHYDNYRKLTPWAYGLIALFVAFVAIAGMTVQGATAWLEFSNLGMSIQPSELAKIMLILMLARHFAKTNPPVNRFGDVLPALAYMLLLFILVVLQNDLGTAIAFIVIIIGIMLAAGVGWRWFAGLAGGTLAFAPLGWMLLSNIQKNRIMVFFDPSLDPTGAGYHVAQSKIAIGSGQLLGKGAFQAGSLTGALDYVPFKETDFIFSVAGETFGLVGGIIILLLFMLLIYRIFRISILAKDRFGSLVCIGVVALLMFHIVENIGMTIGMMPVTGIPLPFISYGGSNMLTNMIAIGLVLNIGMRRGKYGLFERNELEEH